MKVLYWIHAAHSTAHEKARHEERPGAEVLSEVWHLDEFRQFARGDGPLSELARLADDWDEAWEDPLMRAALEDHVPAAGQRFLDALGKSR